MVSVSTESGQIYKSTDLYINFTEYGTENDDHTLGRLKFSCLLVILPF